ncbi:MAG: RNA-binding S4 domain-containing protein [gamma proteobacterium symbiont of Bathyaustriella thionipta]|nr:RNA-binding S4 domain-containing protein [gamma proteobacterium symbiont of Bathyaustriella thionipta]MCU7949251.1 RNA-binding S4 domain-containing protein [gamma proteobacterium symbiont of Bathyaustriella thionipta]MCU7953675.1 RNA-binding S4 domain-containing protein [gamma proteobacterium symbiont of Bathyaustriella thionipta]MCU7955839.1 RNA-binding S4 domain-containing protein [gamma proteobacterium symbiont of Bathyaustriella thionipta]MCU7966933.1 RNA-binding S4 domain-containing pro
MEIFELKGQAYIELNNLLKIMGLCESGGVAKMLIADGQVKVDGQVELRKRCKIRQGQIVLYNEQQIKVS